MRAEIGKIKTQIVFHGDTMNTASRLFHKCQELQEKILISSPLLDKISLPVIYESENLGEMKLKGKKNQLSISSMKNKELVV